MVMTPFIEQIDTRVEVAARVFGAGTPTIFRRILMPLLMPGVLAAALLVLVRSFSMFELTFLPAGAESLTLVFALRSEEGRGGQELVRTCRIRGLPVYATKRRRSLIFMYVQTR